MGYLHQKKQEFRKNLFFQSSALIVAVLTVFFLVFPHFGLPFFNIFHLYCLSFVLFCCALLAKKFKIAVVFMATSIVSYTSLSTHCNIFLSDSFKGTNSITLNFASTYPLISDLSAENVISSGSLIIANKFLASYVVLNEEKPLTVVRVNFRNASRASYKNIFKHLREFIIKQDTPVIIFGDFGLPAWDPLFRRFLNKTDLNVKNRLLFTKSSSFNIFTLPSFYILGFSDMGIDDITVEKLSKGHKLIKAVVSFSLE